MLAVAALRISSRMAVFVTAEKNQGCLFMALGALTPAASICLICASLSDFDASKPLVVLTVESSFSVSLEAAPCA